MHLNDMHSQNENQTSIEDYVPDLPTKEQAHILLTLSCR